MKVIQNADYISIYSSGKSHHPFSEKINNCMTEVHSYLEERQLLEKSTSTLFSPDPAETYVRPDIKIKNKKIFLGRPTISRHTFATKHNFFKHIKRTITKGKKKLNILKSFAGTTWGKIRN